MKVQIHEFVYYICVHYVYPTGIIFQEVILCNKKINILMDFFLLVKSRDFTAESAIAIQHDVIIKTIFEAPK